MIGTASLTRNTASVAETVALGMHLGRLLRPGDVVLLDGPLGAGKTHLVKGIAAAWGVDPAEVNSPTFVLVNTYDSDQAHRRAPILHVDLYRLESLDAINSIGLDDVLRDDALAVIEWAERAADWWPRDHLQITIAHAGTDARAFSINGTGPRSATIVAALADGIADVER